MAANDRQEGGDHYRLLPIQPWDALAAWMTPEEYRGYQKGVAITYLSRERQKGGLTDIRKAIHHLQKLIEVEEQRGPKAPMPNLPPLHIDNSTLGGEGHMPGDNQSRYAHERIHLRAVKPKIDKQEVLKDLETKPTLTFDE